MFKAIALGALLMLVQSLKVDREHEAIVYDKKTGNMAYETNLKPKVDNTYAGPGAVALGDCVNKKDGDDCKLGGLCMTCGGVIQCRYWRQC